MEFALKGPPVPKETCSENDCKKLLTIPYWWVETTSDESVANMKTMQIKFDEGYVPAMTNSVAVKMDSKLFLFVPKKKAEVAAEIAYEVEEKGEKDGKGEKDEKGGKGEKGEKDAKRRKTKT